MTSLVNGIDVTELQRLKETIARDDASAHVSFCVHVRHEANAGPKQTIYMQEGGRSLQAQGERTYEHEHAYELITDLPKAMCGQDSGPTPYELFIAAVASDLLTALLTRATEQDLDVGTVNLHVEAPVNLRAAYGIDDEAARGFFSLHIKADFSGTDVKRDDLVALLDYAKAHSPVCNDLMFGTKLDVSLFGEPSDLERQRIGKEEVSHEKKQSLPQPRSDEPSIDFTAKERFEREAKGKGDKPTHEAAELRQLDKEFRPRPASAPIDKNMEHEAAESLRREATVGEHRHIAHPSAKPNEFKLPEGRGTHVDMGSWPGGHGSRATVGKYEMGKDEQNIEH